MKKIGKSLLVAFAIVLSVRIASAQVVASTTAECATSTDGSVVGTLNPLNVPQVATSFSGTLGSGNYFIQIAWYDAASHITLPSPEWEQQLASTGQLQISPPASGMPATAVGMNVYIGTSSGGETLQGQTTGSSTFIQSTPLSAGAALPTANNTVCQIIANDAGWPTGTGYKVSMTTPAGNTYPGYPQQWQLLGPGSTINLSQGLPLYNGTVTYPVPLLARPYGQAPQSIYGPLSLTNFNLTSVGRIGVGTSTPGWGLDAEGSGINGAVNANTGFLFNGTAPTNHILLGNGTYYVDSATIPGTVLVASLTTTNASSDTVAITGMTASGHCSIGATNSTAAANIALTYISNKTTNQITVTHTTTASMTYDFVCTPQ